MIRTALQSLRKLYASRAATLSTGLVLLSICLMMLADLSGLRTDSTTSREAAREAIAETLSVRLSLLIATVGPGAVDSAIRSFVAESDEVESAHLQQGGGGSEKWYGKSKAVELNTAAANQFGAEVPILNGVRSWGTLRLEFRSIDAHGEDLAYFGFLGLGMLLTFCAYLGKALVQLDPNRAIPERVDNAFNMLVEGVVVLDVDLRILMVNSAAADIIKRPSTELIGTRIEDWPWVRDGEWQAPWTTVLGTGVAISDYPAQLSTSESSNYTVNCSIIRDESGTTNGVMVTLNDLSAMERKNRDLTSALQKLRRSQESITRKNRELETLASQDPLTGLKNRRALVAELSAQLDRSIRGSNPLSCIMVDIDHFKKINDTLGHAVGDEVICAVANTLVDQSRDCDTVGRIGGEEFVVVLPDTESQGAFEIAERIRVRIERLASDVNVPVDTLSASLGVANHDQQINTIEALLDRADQALYRAKNSGRNRVILYDPGQDMIDMDVAVEAATSQGESTERDTGREQELERLLSEKSRDLDNLKTFDPATGLPRREVFMARVEHAIERAARKQTEFTLLYIGLRDNERLSSTLGHEGTTALLNEFAKRLRVGLRSADTLAEVADDHGLSHVSNTEFGVLIENLSEASEVQAVMTRVQELFCTSIMVDGTRVHAGISIGMATYPRDGERASTLVEEAGKVLMETTGQLERITQGLCGNGASALSRETLELESDLFDAISKGELSVEYQPKLDLSSQCICGMEALARWQHPDKGWISPAEFVPLAERNGLIDAISSFVTRTSLRQLRVWHDMGYSHIGLAMNVSPTQLRDPELVANILSELKGAEVSSSRVEVELTETAVIESPQRARIALGQLRSAGIAVSMDDFGTGYTSLALLADLPLDSVKIDRSFVDAMTENDRSRAIVKSIIDMAHTLGLSVVGEGVETNDQLTMLGALGCNEVQGYLISRPMTPDAMTAFLDRQAWNERERRVA